MAVYNPKSMIADEFINDEEIRETLAYADAQGKSVIENYAFSTADATLVKLY